MMSAPRVISVAPDSAAERAGLAVGDEIVAVDGERPRDVIRWSWLTDEPDIELELLRGGMERSVQVNKRAGEPLGIEVHSALFDQVRTCDNHCEFCFIYQLPPGLRKSLYLKDDDYRLSFLFGNFTTLTRFTEADLERVVSERLGPLNVSIHATDPDTRASLLRNRRGAPSLRWLRALLDHGIEIHGQIVCCPGRNDGEVLEQTLAGVLDRFPELASLCVVPLGISRFNPEPAMRSHSCEEAGAVLDTIHEWQEIYRLTLGRRLVFAADEYYLLADRDFPTASAYEGFAMYEDGVGMARRFEIDFTGDSDTADRPHAAGDGAGSANGFFAWVDRSPGPDEAVPATTRYEAAGDFDAPPEGYRADRLAPAYAAVPGPDSAGGAAGGGAESTQVVIGPRRDAPVAILTGEYGARVLAPMLADAGRPDVRILPVENRFFGGNVGVSGLLVGEDLARVLADEPADHRYLLPDVCLSGGRFLDGTSPEDLPRPVDIIPTDGAALRLALQRHGPT